MTDIIEVARKYELNDFAFDYPARFQAFADHYRKEGAEEANKTIENLRAYAKHERSLGAEPFAIELQSVKQQLAAAELVLEQMREKLNAIHDIVNNREYTELSHKDCITVMKLCMQTWQLQPSLSALREFEAKVLINHRCWACGAAQDRMASELRAKGEQSE